MRHQAVNFQIFIFFKFVGKIGKFIKTNADPVHSRIDFYVNIRNHAAFLCRPVKNFSKFCTINDGGDVVV